jgi:FtsP/CotA-like multicopper oxidase with cupredoxin domain
MLCSRALFAMFAAVHTVSGAGVTDVVGAAFAAPEECTSHNCTLEFTVTHYIGPNAEFLTRGFNGGIPGPTIRASAGGTLMVNLINTLEDVDNAGNHNAFRFVLYFVRQTPAR